ncbi:MAG: regulatory protein RecX [Pseudomonadales bacterium]|nr:regulatory protein RecX [Pseudomonadales bacterium]MDG1442161.1 regulatory protein RecX [Pseudomonadales bacterium]
MTELKSSDIRLGAMDLLARREHALVELVRKLEKRFNKPWLELPNADVSLTEMIQVEVERLRAQGLQSDARLTEAFIRARSNRGQGPVKIRMELRGKGVSDELIQSGFDTCEVDWFDLVAVVALKKFGDTPLDAKGLAKRSRFLQQRGFSFDHINIL